MNFLSGQDDFFRTGNQPISVRHLSQPYNKLCYSCENENKLVEICFIYKTTYFSINGGGGD